MALKKTATATNTATAKKAPPSELTARICVGTTRGAAQSVDVLPNGAGFVLASFAGVWLIDSAGVFKRELRANKGTVCWNARVTRDGTRIIAGFGDQKFEVWEIKSGKQTCSLGTSSEIVTRVSSSADGKRAVTASLNTTVRLWDVVAGKELAAKTFPKSFAISAAISADGGAAFCGGTDGVLRCIDVEGDQEVWATPGAGWIEDIDASAEGGIVVAGGRGKALHVYDAASGKKLRSCELGANITMVGVSPDGRFATALAGKRSPPVWDVKTGKAIATLAGHDGGLRSIRFSGDSRTIATTDDGKTTRLFDLPR